jgi:predicted ATPase
MNSCLTFIPVLSILTAYLGNHKIEPFSKQNAIQIIAKQLSGEFKILCLDEFQVIDIADAMLLRNLIGEMVLKNDIKMFLTSNREPASLYDRGIQRESFLPCIKLILEEFLVLDLRGPDYRQGGIGFGRRFFFDKQEFEKTMYSFSNNCIFKL